MTAERSTLIDAVECAILRELYEAECGVRLSDEVLAQIRGMDGASIWGRKVKAAARAALRALHDHGPTPAMVDAGLSVCDGGLDDEANRHYCAKEFRAMLAAELEERQ